MVVSYAIISKTGLIAAQSQQSLKFWVCPQNYAVLKKRHGYNFSFWLLLWIGPKKYHVRPMFYSCGGLKRKNVAVSFFCDTTILQKKFLRFDPTLGSNNSGLKNYRIKNHHIFGIARTSAFIWHIWIPLKNLCKRTRRVCVCIVLVHFGRYSQEVNEKSVKLAVWAVSLNFLFCLW